MILRSIAVALALLTFPTVSHASDGLAEPGSFSDRYLTVGEVRDALHKANPKFQSCFFQHLGPQEPGEVTLSFEVTADGQAQEVFVEIRDGLDELRACLVDVAAGLRYQRHDGDVLTLAYPIVFVQDDQGRRVVKYPIVFVRPRERRFVLIHVPPSLTAEERAWLEDVLYPSMPPGS